MRDGMRRYSFTKIAGIGITAVLSIPLTVLIEKAMGFVTTGTLTLRYLIPDTGGLSDLGRNLAIAIGVDTAICFAVILGLYSLGARAWRKRSPPKHQA
jgi:hypothetical protein